MKRKLPGKLLRVKLPTGEVYNFNLSSKTVRNKKRALSGKIEQWLLHTLKPGKPAGTIAPAVQPAAPDEQMRSDIAA